MVKKRPRSKKSRPAKKAKPNEFPVSHPKVKIGYVSGPTFTNQRIEYVELNGWAIAEGDICLGTAKELRQSSDPSRLEAVAVEAKMSAKSDLPLGAGIIREERYRWPNSTIPYQIDPNLPNQARITDAIRHWEENTSIRFIRRINEPDFLYFKDEGGCWSYVGRQGGRQVVSIGAGCSTGNTIHEIGHAVGLYHEQSRNDRDRFVQINWQNITPGNEHNFNQYLNSGMDVGPYDYCSIMHYPRTAFSRNNQDTITPLQRVVGCTMGQRNGLSPNDIAAINRIMSVPEDCIVFNPNNVRAQRIGLRWKVTDGRMWLLDFGSNGRNAQTAVKIIKHYRLTSQCFVGRPATRGYTPMQYYLVAGAAPTGAFSGEDSIPFNPQTISVQQISRRWKLVDGSHWIYDFNTSEANARNALSIIRRYGFNRICFVGRPNPPMMYFRK